MAVIAEKIQVEVVYALPDHQEVITVWCEKGSTIDQVIDISRILEKYPELAQHKLEVGIFGIKKALDHCVTQYDRVEIYRPLELSPTEARRLRAKLKSD